MAASFLCCAQHSFGVCGWVYVCGCLWVCSYRAFWWFHGIVVAPSICPALYSIAYVGEPNVGECLEAWDWLFITLQH